MTVTSGRVPHLLASRGRKKGPCGPLGGSVHNRPEFVPHLPDGRLQVLEGAADRLVGVLVVELVTEVALERPAGIASITEAADGPADRIELGG
jgi:hypothetical protein